MTILRTEPGESPVTSEGESSEGTSSGSGPDKHSDVDDGPAAWTDPKAPVQPRRRRPTDRTVEASDDSGSDVFRTCPDGSDAGDQDSPSTSHAADARRPHRHRRRPARLDGFITFDSDGEYIDLTSLSCE
ncbi:Annexin A11 [Branchiostoma belcheri]|nr:Annexin A11 [Branchiostoma belcheri]KAI8510311.1 Annexin A11 [Branchiostoma belcheri]